MSLSTLNYWSNLLLLLNPARPLYPRVASYYVTTRCNLNCAYCEDFGSRRNGQSETSLSLEDASRVLRVIRTGVDSLILTGGEPLLYPAIGPLLSYARRELRFRQVTMISNGVLLREHEEVLPFLHRLIISLDSTEPARIGAVTGLDTAAAGALLETIKHYAHRQREFGCRIMINCVVSPETLAGVEAVLAFCTENNLLFSFSPQSLGNWPRYELLVSEEYKALLRRLIAAKRRGAPILGSVPYLRSLLELRPYSCYPTLIPRVMPGGELLYPCRPIEKAHGSQGGRPCNLLEVESWNEALWFGVDCYGLPPRICGSCYQQCYAEISILQDQPLALLWELLRYPASRKGGIGTYAPG